jgi:hypothetical protein
MNPKVSHKPSQPHSNDDKLTVPAQLLTEGKDLEAEFVAGTEESAEGGEEADEK